MEYPEIDYTAIIAAEKEIADHNQQLLAQFGKKALKDFEELMDGCIVDGKIEVVDAPVGDDNNESCGIFKNIHVDQWTMGTEGDSYAGHIYANVKGQWIKVPYYC